MSHSWLLPKSTDVYSCSSAADYKPGAAAAIADQILVFLSFISLVRIIYTPFCSAHAVCQLNSDTKTGRVKQAFRFKGKQHFKRAFANLTLAGVYLVQQLAPQHLNF